ncbi:MAG TPA: tRNA pseudouridine(38-40) synthase TruA [Blastocatellia bacterium]|jgi:tRNA pseudouridine38-40 synthase|nr:tRNA pseudouridine(38-40) synthase TruA [Blastocatellia bacterium]
MKYRITLAYDGADYYGWQAQAGQPTIQSVLNGALEKLEGAPVTTHAAGRTDAGVHAEGQVVSFMLSREWGGRDLRRAVNGNLPPDIRVIDAAPVDEEFHARFDAKSKTYRYQIYLAEVMSPLLVRYAWHYPYPIDVRRLAEESGALLGTRDFTAFTVADCETRTFTRTLMEIDIQREGDLLKLFFTGDGFLRYQVRTMVAALVESNRGRLKAGSISELIESKDRALAGPPAPARGLTLMKVEYRECLPMANIRL